MSPIYEDCLCRVLDQFQIIIIRPTIVFKRIYLAKVRKNAADTLKVHRCMLTENFWSHIKCVFNVLIFFNVFILKNVEWLV